MASCIGLTGCLSVADLSGPELANTFPSNSTYIMYEIPKGKFHISSLTMCPYRAERYFSVGLSDRVGFCSFKERRPTDKVQKPFSFSLTHAAAVGDVKNRFVLKAKTDSSFGEFHFLRIEHPEKLNENYIAAFTANRPRAIIPKLPTTVHKIEKGKVNYIGKWDGNLTEQIRWESDGVIDELRRRKITLPLDNFVFNPPEKAIISCRGVKNIWTRKRTKLKRTDLQECKATPVVIGNQEQIGN